MNDTSRELVSVACDAILARHALVNHPLTVETVAAVATAAALDRLAKLLSELDDSQVDCLEVDGLRLLARDIEESL